VVALPPREVGELGGGVSGDHAVTMALET
jgi:hypothetical protein